MNLRYRLIQFVADPYREEGRNIAVIVYANAKTYVRALGVDKHGHINTEWFAQLLPGPQREEAWVYREWANWWRDLVENSAGDIEAVDATLERLNAKGISMTVTGGGDLEMPDEQNPKEAVEWLYRRLIGDDDVFDAKLGEAVQWSEMEYRGNFSRDAVVRLEPTPGEQGLAVDLYFSYLVEPSSQDPIPRTAFKVLRFGGVTQENLLKTANDAVYTFETAVQRAYLEPNRCAVLTDAPGLGQEALYERLAAIAKVIDVTADDARSRVHRFLTGQMPAF